MSGRVVTKAMEESQARRAKNSTRRKPRRPGQTRNQANSPYLPRAAGNRAMSQYVKASQEQPADDMLIGSSQVQEVVGAPGMPLDPALQASMEEQLGVDFSQVQVHTGSLAATSAEALGALAYTLGDHIVFTEGLYQPDTEAGTQLLAHELAHVAQQALQPGSAGQVWRSPGAGEQQAKGKARALEQAQAAVERGLKTILRGGVKDIQSGCQQIRAGAGYLQNAVSDALQAEKARLNRVADFLLTYAAIATASYAGEAGRQNVRKMFQKQPMATGQKPQTGGEAIRRGEFARAGRFYRNVYQDFCDVFPDLAASDYAMPLIDLATALQERAGVMEAMKQARATPESYPPTPAEVEGYFTKLGKANTPTEDIAQAYEDYAQAFFEHHRAEFSPRDMGTARVYQGKQSIIGTIHTDCDGYVRLGVRLFTLAGFKLDKIIVGVKNFSIPVGKMDHYADVHAVGQLTRGGETVFVSNDEVYHSSESAFADIAWDHPEAELIYGEGLSVAEANQDAVVQLRRKK